MCFIAILVDRGQLWFQ